MYENSTWTAPRNCSVASTPYTVCTVTIHISFLNLHHGKIQAGRKKEDPESGPCKARAGQYAQQSSGCCWFS
jgi:hypothetical protein